MGPLTLRPLSGADRTLAIESFVPLCHQLCSGYRHWSVDECDWFQAAMVAVIGAVDSYPAGCAYTLGQFVGQNVKWALGDYFKRLRRGARGSRQLPDQVGDVSAVEYEDEDDSDRLWAAVDALPRGDRAILVAFWGLGGKAPASRERLGRRHRRSVTAISASTKRSMGRLRLSLRA